MNLLLPGQLHNCSGVEAPPNKACYEEFSDQGYRFDCIDSCPGDCITDRRRKRLCASDLVTYDGACEMSKSVCEMYGDLENDEQLRNFNEIEKLHEGACGK